MEKAGRGASRRTMGCVHPLARIEKSMARRCPATMGNSARCPANRGVRCWLVFRWLPVEGVICVARGATACTKFGACGGGRGVQLRWLHVVVLYQPRQRPAARRGQPAGMTPRQQKMMGIMVRGRSERWPAPQHGEAPAALCHPCGLHWGPTGVHRAARPPHCKSSRPKRRCNIEKGAARCGRAAMGNNGPSRLLVCRGARRSPAYR